MLARAQTKRSDTQNCNVLQFESSPGTASVGVTGGE